MNRDKLGAVNCKGSLHRTERRVNFITTLLPSDFPTGIDSELYTPGKPNLPSSQTIRSPEHSARASDRDLDLPFAPHKDPCPFSVRVAPLTTSEALLDD